MHLNCSHTRNNKGPKLLFNTSVHSLPIKVSYANAQFKKSLLYIKKVTAVLGKPSYEGIKGHNNSRHANTTLWRVLLDSGSDGDILFQRKGTRKGVPYTRRVTPQLWHTSMGNFKTEKLGEFELEFPEYSRSKRVALQPDIVEFDSDEYTPQFDLILGTQTMQELGIILDFKQKFITIDEICLPMRKLKELKKPNIVYQMYKNTEPKSTAEMTDRAVRILDANYEKADLPAVVNDTCSHLSSADKQELLELLQKYETLFDGTLGEWKTKPVHFELKEGATPFHGRPYPVPQVHKAVMKKEVDRMVELGILKWEGESEWASPSFIIPKSNQTVRFITDFRELNKRLKRKPWPLPKITETLQELEGFTFASQLDLNMGYYTIRLDPDSSKICTIILPWGKYSYQRLPMGVAGSPDIFQERMTDLMRNLEFVRAYIDDLLVISKDSFKDHLEKLDTVLKRLRDAGLKVNAKKSTFGLQEVEYLGYILTREGIKPQMDKVRAILAIERPTSVKTLRSFLGIVQYYRDLWEKRSEMLAPLTDLVAECGVTKSTKEKGTKKKPFYWNETHQKAFDDVKRIIARDVILAYPDYSEEFEIYTDASTRQLGAVITQKNRPIAFFSRKLSDAQTRYSVTELELLAITETLKEFKGMLWGQKLKVYTDHKNLTRDALGLTCDRVYRWRVLLEEYAPEIVYIKGIHNTVADAISRLDYCPNVEPDAHANFMQHVTDVYGVHESHFKWKTVAHCFNMCMEEQEDCTEAEISTAATPESHSVFATSRGNEEQEEIYPLSVSEIADAQRADKVLRKFFKNGGASKRSRFVVSLIENTRVITDEKSKLVIPKMLQRRAVMWYHHYLQHPGATRLEETLRASMTWDGLRQSVRKYTETCDTCQKSKRAKHKYGKLPTKLAVTKPWATLSVDLIGPYTLKGKDKSQLDFMCLTMIDPATSWFEIVELPVVVKPAKDGRSEMSQEMFDKTSKQIARLVNKSWFSRYPRCNNVVYDNGSEFKLYFQELIDSYNIKKKPTPIKNPQANAVLERVHQVIANMLRTSSLDMAETVDPDAVSDFLDNAAWAIRSTYHTVLKSSPGAAIFGRDMLFDIPYLADWNKIGEHRQVQIDRNTARENAQRADYDYKVGGQVLVRKDGILRKAESKYTGPYKITTVHTNGTIRIQRGAQSERLNIRRVKPYHALVSDDEG